MITKIKVIIIFLLNLFNYSETNIKDFKILDYETEYVFAENYAEDEEFIINKGEKGYSYIENDQEVTKEPVKEVVKKGTRTNNDFSGTLTGYGPDCKGCSKIGTVACSTKDNKNWSLINDGIIYEDDCDMRRSLPRSQRRHSITRHDALVSIRCAQHPRHSLRILWLLARIRL